MKEAVLSFRRPSLIILLFLLVAFTGCNQKEDAVSFDPAVLGRLNFDSSKDIDFGEVVVNTVNDREMVVTNPGKFDATAITFGAFDPAGPFSFLGGDYPGIGGNCGDILLAGSSCNIVVRFFPNKMGKFQEAIPVRLGNGVEFTTSKILAKGMAGLLAGLNTEKAVYYLGALNPGQSKKIKIEVTNPGGMTAKNIEMTFVPVNDFEFTGGSYPGTDGTCGTQLIGGASCWVDITYNSNSIGAKSTVLRMKYFNGLSNSLTPVSLKAITDVIEGKLALQSTDAFYNFGQTPIGGHKNLNLTFKNIGYEDLTITQLPDVSQAWYGLARWYDSPYKIDLANSNCLGRPIAVNEICSIIFKYSPTMEGRYPLEDSSLVATSGKLIKGDIIIDYNGGLNDKQLVLNQYLRGMGLLAAFVDINLPEPVEFELTGVGYTQLLNLEFTNLGKLDATSFNTTFTSATTAISGLNSTCSSTIKKGGVTCSMSLLFQPQQTGVFTSELTFNYYNGVENVTRIIPISGRAIRKAKLKLISVDKSALDNPLLTTAMSAPIFITVKNTGSGTARDLKTNVFAPYFYYNMIGPYSGTFPGALGDCPADGRLPPDQQCTMAFAVSYRSMNTAFDLKIGYNNGIEDEEITSDDDLFDLVLQDLKWNVVFLKPGALTWGASNTLHWKFPGLLGNFPVEQNHGTIGNITIAQSGDFDSQLTQFDSYIDDVVIGGVPSNCPGDGVGEGLTLNTNTCIGLPLTLGPGSSGCSIAVNFFPQCVGLYRGHIDYTYTTTLPVVSTVSKTINFEAESKNLGVLKIMTANPLNLSTLTGIPVNGVIKLKNIGTGNAIYEQSVTGHYAVELSPLSGDCNGTEVELAPGEECEISVDFYSDFFGIFPKQIVFNYDNSDDFDDFDTMPSNDNYAKKVITANISAIATNVSSITLNNGATSLNVGSTTVGTQIPEPVPPSVTAPTNLAIKNVNGVTTTINLALIGPAAARYSLSQASCPALAAPNTCNVTIFYDAPAEGLLDNSPATLEASYFDGKDNQIKLLTLTTTTATPNFTHKAWERIKAESAATTTKVTLKWYEFETGANTINHYLAYRRPSWNPVYNFNTPLSGDISFDDINRTFIDNTAEQGKEYYYMIVPVYVGMDSVSLGTINDYPSFGQQSFKEVQIITPPKYMSLIHRWEANRQVCQEYLGTTPLPTSNFSCSGVSGEGTSGGKFDIGKHIFVDRYETNKGGAGITDYHQPLAEPKVLSQQDAWNYCTSTDRQVSLTINQNNLAVTVNRNKKILGMMEYRIAAEFEDSTEHTHATCADTEANVTGTRADCISRHGIYDLVGNGWEWLRDRMLGAKNTCGASSCNTNIDNNSSLDSYLNGLDYSGTTTYGQVNAYYPAKKCQSLILGMPVPVPQNTNFCSLVSPSYADIINTNEFTLSYFQTPIDMVNNTLVPTMLKAGGAYDPGDGAKLSKLNLLWIVPDANSTATFRCSFTY
jgi:hypothetical protein